MAHIDVGQQRVCSFMEVGVQSAVGGERVQFEGDLLAWA